MIEFENVSFAYTGQEHDGLRDINLKISDGECVLFCGRILNEKQILMTGFIECMIR